MPSTAPVLRFAGGRLARVPTGAKILLFISAALLPLAVIAIFATLSTTRRTGQEASARLRVAATEASRALAIELAGDMQALGSTSDALAADPGNAPSCARAFGVFAGQAARGARFVVLDCDGRRLCGTGLDAALPSALPGRGVAARIEPGRGVVLALAQPGGNGRAAAFFPTGFLADIARPTGFTSDYRAALLTADGRRLTLRAADDAAVIAGREVTSTELGLEGLSLELSTRTTVLTSPVLIALLLPLLMWAAAAGLAWFVADRLLIRPLRQLGNRIAAFRPGEEIDPGAIRAMPAVEIRELGETFQALSRNLAAHEAGLAQGLQRQTRLTREVHHRVKNNLQVISSLINLHSRGAGLGEAARAYAVIQRRVDALAVVHRHHFAELEDTRGLPLRAVIGELASNFRATAPGEGANPGFLLEIEPFYVTQDVAVAIAFLLTELIELAMTCDPSAKLRVSVRAGEHERQAMLRVSSPALIDSERLRAALDQRYARVAEGLARQLRSKLHHEPLGGGYEIAVAVLGRD